MTILAALLLLAAEGPTQAALADARTVAENGMLATVARVKTAAEINAMVAEHPELADPDKAKLRHIGEASAAALIERAIAAEATAYAANLAPTDLAALAAFVTSDAAKAQRAAMPRVMQATIMSLSADGEIDFGGDTMKAFCAETGKLCGEK